MEGMALLLLFFCGERCRTAKASQIARRKHGVSQQSPPEHDMRDRRKTLQDAVYILFVDQISVIAERHLCPLRGQSEHIEVNRSPVKLLLNPRVDYEFRERKVVVDFEYLRKLRRVLYPESRLHAELRIRRQVAKNLFKKVPERRELRKKARALFLCRDRPRGAAEVQIKFFVAVVSQNFRGKEKILRVVRE